MGSANPKAKDTFDEEKEIVVNLIKMPKDTSAKYGIVQFGEEADTKIPLGSKDDEEKLTEYVKILPWKEEGKSLDKGIKRAAMEFEKNGRPGAQKVLIIFVDGNDENDEEDISEAARPLKNKNIEIIPVVMGDIDEDKIKQLTPKNKKPKRGKDPKELTELVAEEALIGNLKIIHQFVFSRLEVIQTIYFSLTICFHFRSLFC